MIAARPLRPSDCIDVLRINAAAGATVFRLDMQELSRLMEISSLHLAAVQGDGTVVGYALAFAGADAYDGEEFLALRSSIDEPFLYVDQIAIDGQFRGIGVGRALYEALVAGAGRRGATALCAEVNASPPNPSSMAFHRRMGFRQVSELDTRDGRTVALLKREVNA